MCVTFTWQKRLFSSLYCHVKSVSETGLSLEVQTKHCLTRVTQATAKLQTRRFGRLVRQHYWNSCVCRAALNPRDCVSLQRERRGRETPMNTGVKGLGLVVINVILTTVSQPAEVFINSLATEFTSRSVVEKRDIPEEWTQTRVIVFSYKVFTQPRRQEYSWGIFRLNATCIV